jgi:hypothetical protein
MTRAPIATLLVGTAFLAVSAAVVADEYEQEPIRYSESEPSNCVSELQQQLLSGTTSLKFDDHFGYLPNLLEVLRVPVSSQVLVYSKTSLQLSRISPKTPRAIYFNDDVYIGYCQSGDVLEISAVDPVLGTVFYTLDQHSAEKPQFIRQTDNCLLCHSSSRTDGVPGHLARSLLVDSRGVPIYSAGSRTVDQTTPIAERWGGWYVTGTHGEQRHMGNLIGRDPRARSMPENPDGLNLVDLTDRFDVSSYLSPHSDLVALMVLEHQLLVHNRITKASYATRQALHYQQVLNKELGEPVDHRLESVTRRIQSAGDDLLAAMLFVGEAPLTGPMKGTSGFTEEFAAVGQRDSAGRSLRDFDLTRRIFRHPCSYLVESAAFRALPPEMRDYLGTRLGAILAGEDTSGKFAHLSADDRAAIRDVLMSLEPDVLPKLSQE